MTAAAHRVGDLVWAKQQGFSWWPCIVTYDPDHGLFTKTCTDKKSAAKTKKEVVHVQFLGHEKPARAWLNTSALQPWADTKEEHLTQKVKERFLPDWQRALDDCEETCELTRAQRIERHAGVFGRADSDDEGDEGDEGEKTDTAEVVAQDKTQIRWTKGMDAKLMKIVLLYGVPKRWKQITSWMGCGLSVKQVQNHWRGMKKWYEKGLLEQKIKEFTAAALAEGIDLEAMDFSTAPAMTSTSQKCQICSNGAGAMLACVGGCGSCFHRVCIGLARTPKAFVCDQCYLNEVSTDDVPSAQLSRSQKAAQRPVTPGTIEADDLVPSEQLADARQKGVSRKRHAPEQERTAKDGDLQEEEEEEEEDADENDDDDELCVVCSSGADSARMLLCDGCDDGYHLDCLSPKMERIPSGLWFCPTCSGARKDCTACNGSQGAHTCGTVGRRDDATGEEKSAAVKRVRTSGATAASGSKKRKTGSFDRVPQPVTRRQDDAAHAAQVESIAALNQSIAGYTDSVLSGGGRSRRASTAASTKATDFLRVAQVVQDQNVSGHQPKEDGKPQQRIAMWSKSKRVVIKGWKAPMKKHLEKFLWSHPECEVYNGQDGREVAAASEAVTVTLGADNIESRGGSDKLSTYEDGFRTDPTGQKGVWCSYETRQCQVCRLGRGWCKRRGLARHLAGPGGALQAEVAALPLPRAPMSTARIPAGAVCSMSQRPAQVNSVSRRAEKLIEQEKMLARRGWTTQQVLLHWSADMECLQTVDRVARNLTGRWARGSSDRWEKRSKTPTPKESAAALEEARQVAIREAELKAEKDKQEKQKQAEEELRRRKMSGATKPAPPQFQYVCLWNTETRKRLTGQNRPRRKDLNAFLDRYPKYVLYTGQDQQGREAVTVASNQTEHVEPAASESPMHTAEPPLQRHVGAPPVSSARSWTEEEEQALFQMFDNAGSENFSESWLEFAAKLGTGRSSKAIQARHARYLNRKVKTSRACKPPPEVNSDEVKAAEEILAEEAAAAAAAGAAATEAKAEANAVEEKTAEEAASATKADPAEVKAAEETSLAVKAIAAEAKAVDQAAGKRSAEEKWTAEKVEQEVAVAAAEEEQRSKPKAEEASTAATAAALQQPVAALDTNGAASSGVAAALPEIGSGDLKQEFAPARTGPWSSADDTALIALVGCYGEPRGSEWGNIARRIGRSAAGCESRWKRYLCPNPNDRPNGRSQARTVAPNPAQASATDVQCAAQDAAQLTDIESTKSTEPPKHQGLSNSDTNVEIASEGRTWVQDMGVVAVDDTTNAFDNSDSHVMADTQQTQTPTISLVDSATDTVLDNTATGPGSPNGETVAATATKTSQDVSEDSQSTYLSSSAAGPRAMTPPAEMPLPGGPAAAASECIDLIDDTEDSDDGACGDTVSPVVEGHAGGQQDHTTVTADPPPGAALPPVTAHSGSVTSNGDPHDGHRDSTGKLRYTVGQRLSMRFQHNGGYQGWYPGTIAKVHADEPGSGCFDIMFDDGGVENNVYDIDPDLVIEWPVAADSDATGVKLNKRKAETVESEAVVAAISQKRKRSISDAYPPVGTQVRVKHEASKDSLGRAQSKAATQKWGGQTGVVVGSIPFLDSLAPARLLGTMCFIGLGADHGFVRVLFSQEPQSNGARASGVEVSNVNRQRGSQHQAVTVAIRLQSLEILLPGFHGQSGATRSQDAGHRTASNPSQSSTALCGTTASLPNDTGSLVAAPEEASSTNDGNGSISAQQQADSASAAAIGSAERPRGRERKLSRRLVECLESM